MQPEIARHTVETLVASVSDDDLVAALGRMYEADQQEQASAYLEMLAALRTMAPEPTIFDCLLTRVWSRDDPPEPSVDVSGVIMGDRERYAIEYQPWREWLGMAVTVEPNLELSPADMLANILYEMSWAGFDEEEIAAQMASILESAEEVKDLMDAER
jgi:hypothetical protein